MNTKLIVAILVVTAISMAITPAILDTAFADKGGEPNQNSQKICVKGSDQKKCIIDGGGF